MADDDLEPRLFDPGPELEPGPLELAALSTDRRRTIRRRQLLAAGTHPTTKRALRTPAGETCGSCANLVEHRLGRTYWKCGAIPLTGGPATDVRLSWPACNLWRGDVEATESPERPPPP